MLFNNNKLKKKWDMRHEFKWDIVIIINLSLAKRNHEAWFIVKQMS